MRRRVVSLLQIGLLLALTLLPGCGGGSSGTGTRIYEGRISNASGTTLPPVKITLEQTGDSTFSDSAGYFVLVTEQTEEVSFELKGNGIDARVSPNEVPAESETTWVDILLTMDNNAAEVEHYSASASFVGLCEAYFEDGSPIKQKRQLKNGTLCSLKVKVWGDGLARGNIPIMLQRGACANAAGWEDYVGGTTGVGIYRGQAEINFRFFDTPRSCKYRVVVPYGIPDKDALGIYIETVSKQKRDSRAHTAELTNSSMTRHLRYRGKGQRSHEVKRRV